MKRRKQAPVGFIMFAIVVGILMLAMWLDYAIWESDLPMWLKIFLLR